MNKLAMFVCILALAWVIAQLCGCGLHVKHREYLLNGSWQRCDYTGTQACGESFNCGDTVLTCMVDVQERLSE